ncbi:MAG: hypothetical protein HUU35_04975 [Armatimonadetes bacterium]|nr:hypothetical protein [Armatimonadota bacterium]
MTKDAALLSIGSGTAQGSEHLVAAPGERQAMAELARQVVAVRYDVSHGARQHGLLYHGVTRWPVASDKP